MNEKVIELIDKFHNLNCPARCEIVRLRIDHIGYNLYRVFDYHILSAFSESLISSYKVNIIEDTIVTDGVFSTEIYLSTHCNDEQLVEFKFKFGDIV